MIDIKTAAEIAKMRQGGRITGSVLQHVLRKARPGITTADLDTLAGHLIRNAGAKPSFPMVPRYHHTICTTVNEQVVHGIPGPYVLQRDDLLGIDIGVYHEGFHTDAAWTILVSEEGSGKQDTERVRFLSVGERALQNAIKQATIGNTIGDISHAIQVVVQEAGYAVVREFIGHGVGRKLHEDPSVPGLGKPESGPLLAEGMTIAIEVIYTMGSPTVRILYDNWTVVTADGSMAGLFEHSVAITKNGPQILTLGSVSDTLVPEA